MNASAGTVVAGGNGPGTSTTQLFNPRRLHFCLLSNSVLIANSNAHNIVRWVLAASSWILVAGSGSGSIGSTSSLLNAPPDLALNSMGNMYVADEQKQRIQLFLLSQLNGTTIAGVTGTSGGTSLLFDGPCAVAIDNEFNLYVTDIYNHRVQKFIPYLS
jgi:DNA-binding beta-propeller fold protein YncE